MKFTTLICIVLALAVSGYGQQTVAHKARASSVTWKISNLKSIDGHVPTVLGAPQLIKAPGGKALLFDGTDDGLLVEANPIAGAQSFTVEAFFRPDPEGNKEQRWFHIQEATGDNRVLLEVRLVGDEWFLDTFIKQGEHRLTLYAEHFKHPLGRWYHVALVFDGAEMRHYVDGQEELSGPLTIAPLTNGSVAIGMRMNRVQWFKGAIRAARFTPRALTPQKFMKQK
ncbi:MAG: LamG domain-containing protein [Pyrinomonadaceae bacterium]